jgi:3-oxoacyl-ACP reductase-like protein
MSIFGKIKDAIFGKAAAQPAPAPAQAPAQKPAMPQMQQPAPAPAAQAPAAPAATAQAPQQPVDVETVLMVFETERGTADLNWRTSIVDLMKLLSLDSSLDNRKALAAELGYSGARDGSAEMNIWLHKAVMRELEKNGGQVPAGLKD